MARIVSIMLPVTMLTPEERRSLYSLTYQQILNLYRSKKIPWYVEWEGGRATPSLPEGCLIVRVVRGSYAL